MLVIASPTGGTTGTYSALRVVLGIDPAGRSDPVLTGTVVTQSIGGYTVAFFGTGLHVNSTTHQVDAGTITSFSISDSSAILLTAGDFTAGAPSFWGNLQAGNLAIWESFTFVYASGDGRDYQLGGNGADTFGFVSARDEVVAGGGDDTINVVGGSLAPFLVDGGAGTDTMVVEGSVQFNYK